MSNEHINAANRLYDLPRKPKGSPVDLFIRELMQVIINKINDGWTLKEIYEEIKNDMPAEITDKTFATKYRIIRKQMVDEGVQGIAPGTPGRPRKPR